MSYGTQHPDRRPTELLASMATVVLAAALVLALPLTTPQPASAAVDPCPNAAIRAQQGSTHLPDCRAWELVSQADKGGSQIGTGALLSADGNRAFYSTLSGVPGSSAGSRPRLIATRTPEGWRSKSVMPPIRTDMVADTYYDVVVSPDLSSWIASAQDGLAQPGVSPDGSLVRLDENGGQELLHTFATYFGASGIETVASEDLTHVFANVPESIDPSHQPGTQNVYDFGSGTPELVSVMPGTGEAPACGVDFERGFAQSDSGTAAQHWVSTDGSRVFFATSDDDCGDPLRLYRRDRDAETSTPISGPALPGDEEAGLDYVIQAAADGSWVVYRTPTSLAAGDDTDGNSADQDIYRWDEGAGNSCITCLVPSARVSPGLNRAAASVDGSHLYFTSNQVFAEATVMGTGGAPNLYVIRAGTIHFISRITGAGAGVTNFARNGGYLTPDGQVLVFYSSRPELNAISGSSNGGFGQYYRYDDGDESVTCLSCPPPGLATAQSDPILASNGASIPAVVRAASDDGDTIFFPAADALVPEDVNGQSDLYQWRDGEVSMITSGLGHYGSRVPQFNGASADGRDVLFTDSARLTFDVQDGVSKLYDARVGGGFSAPSVPATCPAEACLPPPARQPGALGPGSDAFAGAGNLAPHRAKPRKCPKGKHRVKGRCVKKNRANANRRTSR